MLDDPQTNPLMTVIEPVCVAHGVELVDVAITREPGGAVLRVLIDRERPELVVEGAPPQPGMDDRPAAPALLRPGSGVSLEDCQAVSRDLSVALDVHEDIAPKIRYRLEVGSPGLDRPLTRRRDFERYAGHEVRVQTRLPLPGAASSESVARRRFNGVLRGVEGDNVKVMDGPEMFDIPITAIAKANLVYRFAQKSSGKQK